MVVTGRVDGARLPGEARMQNGKGFEEWRGGEEWKGKRQGRTWDGIAGRRGKMRKDWVNMERRS